MSGFTTTGATVTTEISFEQHSHAVLMWRQLTQWLGGMGIIVLMVAILPQLAVNGAELMKSEAPGPGFKAHPADRPDRAGPLDHLRRIHGGPHRDPCSASGSRARAGDEPVQRDRARLLDAADWRVLAASGEHRGVQPRRPVGVRPVHGHRGRELRAVLVRAPRRSDADVQEHRVPHVPRAGDRIDSRSRGRPVLRRGARDGDRRRHHRGRRGERAQTGGLSDRVADELDRVRDRRLRGVGHPDQVLPPCS